MKVLLVKPCSDYPYIKGDCTYNRIWPPLELINCCAILVDAGVDARILDAHAQRLDSDSLTMTCDEYYDAIIVSSSSLDRWQCPPREISSFYNTCMVLRDRTDKLIITGYHCSLSPFDVLRSTSADVALLGEPEVCVLSLVESDTFAGIDGVAFFDEGKEVMNPLSEAYDLGASTVSGHERLDYKYYNNELLPDRFAILETARGCRYKCSFCTQVMYPPPFRKKRIELLKQEIFYLLYEKGINSFFFIDLDFLTDRDYVKDLCEWIISLKLEMSWGAQTRADRVDEDILVLMRAAGCVFLEFGIESASKRVLSSTGKGVGLSDLRNAFSLTYRLGIKTVAFVLVGFKSERLRDICYTLFFLYSVLPDIVSFHMVQNYNNLFWLKDLKKNDSRSRLKLIAAYTLYYGYPGYWIAPRRFLLGTRMIRLFFARMKGLVGLS